MDNIITYAPIFISLGAFLISMMTFINHKERYLKQKAYEWAADKVMDYLRLTEDCWHQSTKVQPFISYIAARKKDDELYKIYDDKLITSEQKQDLDTLKGKLLDLRYFFMNKDNPLVTQVLNETEMKMCFDLLKKYEPFSMGTFVNLEIEGKFKDLHNDLLLMSNILSNAISKKII